MGNTISSKRSVFATLISVISTVLYLRARLWNKKIKQYYNAAELVTILSAVAPRDMPSDVIEKVAKLVFSTANVEDTTATSMLKGVNVEYIEQMSSMMVALKNNVHDPRELIKATIRETGFSFDEQKSTRLHFAQQLCTLRNKSDIHWQEMLLGCAIGDAFGAGVEFRDGEWIQKNVDGSQWVCLRGDPVLGHKRNNPLKAFAQFEGNGRNYLPGMYTDDCEMTVGLMHAMMNNIELKLMTADHMIDFWTTEYHKVRSHYLLSRIWALYGVGRNGHGGIARVYEGRSTISQLQNKNRTRRFPGNAPPMRAIPLSFVSDRLIVQLNRINADTTHPHPKARAASLLISLAGRHFIIDKKEPKTIIPDVIIEMNRLLKLDAGADDLAKSDMIDNEIIPYLESVDSLPAPGSLHGPYDEFLSPQCIEILCGKQPIWDPPKRPYRVCGLDADAQRTAGCVLYLLKHHHSGQPLETLLRCLYIGGDVDSLAALCLAIVGGRDGLNFGCDGGIPIFLLQQLEAVEYLSLTASSFGDWVENNKKLVVGN